VYSVDIAVMPKFNISAGVIWGLGFTEIRVRRAVFCVVKVFYMHFCLLCFTLFTACIIVTDLNS